MAVWDACAFPTDKSELEGHVCYGGLGLSSTTDITAFVLVFPPEDEDDKYIILPYFWIPEDNIDLRVRRDHVPYGILECQDLLMTTEGNVVHYGYIEKFIESLGEKYNIREIAYDRWGAVQMVQFLCILNWGTFQCDLLRKCSLIHIECWGALCYHNYMICSPKEEMLWQYNIKIYRNY